MGDHVERFESALEECMRTRKVVIRRFWTFIHIVDVDFFKIKKNLQLQVKGVIGRCQKQIILIIAYSRNRTLPKSQGTNLYSRKVK